ncbi:hypothetical protein ACFWNH_29360 [Rhodococcus qingshengii]|uniref:hypothetical protein n=1 Tax=Rhodococcus qingshengii TaxID=334542 RepID=UPI00365078B5
MEPMQWELFVPIIFSLTLTQVAGTDIAQLFALSDSIGMQRTSKFIEICTAITVVTSGVVVYFAWGTDFPNPVGHEKDVFTSYMTSVLVQVLIASPGIALIVIAFWQVIRWLALAVFQDLVLYSWSLLPWSRSSDDGFGAPNGAMTPCPQCQRGWT